VREEFGLKIKPEEFEDLPHFRKGDQTYFYNEYDFIKKRVSENQRMLRDY